MASVQRLVSATTWLSPTEAARRAGVGVDTIRRWADRGQVVSSRTAGGHRRIDSESLGVLLAEGRKAARSVDVVEAVEQFRTDSEAWWGWVPPASWTVDRADEFLRAIDDCEATLRQVRAAAVTHLDDIGG